LVFIAVLSPTASKAAVTFERRWGWGVPLQTSGNTVDQTWDGGYVIGACLRLPDMPFTAALIKTDSFGFTQWVRTVIPFSQDEHAAATRDSGYIITCEVQDNPQEPYTDLKVVKFDSRAESVWSYTYVAPGFNDPGSIMQTSGGDYLVCGNLCDSTGCEHCGLIDLSPQGEVVWIGRYLAHLDWAGGQEVCETRDGGYLALGDAGAGDSGFAYLVKTNETGDTEWTRAWYGMPLCSVQQTWDGGYFALGYAFDSTIQGDRTWLLKLDSHGDSLWSRYLGPQCNNSCSAGLALRQTSDGNYVAACVFQYSSSVRRIHLYKLDSLGSTLWARMLGSCTADLYWPRGLCVTRDGGLAVVGDASTGPNSSAYLAKTDSLGAYLPETDSLGQVAGIGGALPGTEPASGLTVEPSPCTRDAAIRFQTCRAGLVRLAVYDDAGRRRRTLAHESMQPGFHFSHWNRDDDAGRALPGGIYFLRLDSPGLSRTQKVVLAR
jgi:hypothetical protein